MLLGAICASVLMCIGGVQLEKINMINAPHLYRESAFVRTYKGVELADVKQAMDKFESIEWVGNANVSQSYKLKNGKTGKLNIVDEYTMQYSYYSYKYTPLKGSGDKINAIVGGFAYVNCKIGDEITVSVQNSTTGKMEDITIVVVQNAKYDLSVVNERGTLDYCEYEQYANGTIIIAETQKTKEFYPSQNNEVSVFYDYSLSENEQESIETTLWEFGIVDDVWRSSPSLDYYSSATWMVVTILAIVYAVFVACMVVLSKIQLKYKIIALSTVLVASIVACLICSAIKAISVVAIFNCSLVYVIGLSVAVIAGIIVTIALDKNSKKEKKVIEYEKI